MNQFYGKEPEDVDKPKWEVIRIDSGGLKVNYQEKYGSMITEVCIGLWENDTQYMMTYRDSKKVILEKSNVVSIGAVSLI